MIIEMILEIALHAQTKRNDTRGKKQSSIQWPSASSFVVVFLAKKKKKNFVKVQTSLLRLTKDIRIIIIDGIH